MLPFLFFCVNYAIIMIFFSISHLPSFIIICPSIWNLSFVPNVFPFNFIFILQIPADHYDHPLCNTCFHQYSWLLLFICITRLCKSTEFTAIKTVSSVIYMVMSSILFHNCYWILVILMLSLFLSSCNLALILFFNNLVHWFL